MAEPSSTGSSTRPVLAEPFHLLVALGATSDYLSWTSSGGPYPSLIPRLTRALARSGHAEDGDAFRKCMTPAMAAPVTVAGPATPADPEIPSWSSPPS